jgi:gluconokinase
MTRPPPLPSPPSRLIIMGVSGCGKSTLATALGQALAWDSVDGDDLHHPQSVLKMASGVALTDEDRWPWLDRVAYSLCAGTAPAAGLPGRVIACSALRRVYRERLRERAPGVRFVFLDASAELLRKRMRDRSGHFMDRRLLASQLDTLERPAPDEKDILSMNADQPVHLQVALIQRLWFNNGGAHAPV